MSPLCKLIWLRENQPGLFKAAHKFISIKEYVWHRLFNRFEVDYSIASATGLFDIKKLCWSQGACILAGISVGQLSDVVDTDHVQTGLDANIAASLNIPQNTPFVIGASDGCCANLGSHVTGSGVAALTIGTSGAVRITGNQPIYNYPGMTFNYLLNHNTFVSGGAVNNGGIAVDWLLKTFLNKTELNTADYQTLFTTIQTVPAGSYGLIFLPYLYGERAPIWDAKSSGSYLNIKPQHKQAHFLRAALEGICYALYDVLRGLEEASANIHQINISGGFITSPVWVQLLADITGKKLMILQPEDASAIGAIYLAMAALYPQINLPQTGTGHIIYPDKENHQLYAKIFPLFKKLYHDLKESMHLLQQLNN
jgi:gluconokinase